ncbi:hypothetical protein [Calothrix rhizosoleniae]|uniref:hypothetical protein n=1 Tax=Calothrix rhizosoleniae TaxID=888997 RepID=UPI00117846CF|nr:hypothetical protein [Calothrix rhizosoleniae]
MVASDRPTQHCRMEARRGTSKPLRCAVSHCGGRVSRHKASGATRRGSSRCSKWRNPKGSRGAGEKKFYSLTCEPSKIPLVDIRNTG